MSSEMRELVQAKVVEWRAEAAKMRVLAARARNRGDHSTADIRFQSAQDSEAYASELEALLARTEAGALTFANVGASEAQFITDGEHLNCPACGGSGHVGDVLRGHGLMLKSGVYDRNDNFVGTFRDWDMAAFVGEMLVKADANSHPEYTGFQIIDTHSQDASAVSELVAACSEGKSETYGRILFDEAGANRLRAALAALQQKESGNG